MPARRFTLLTLGSRGDVQPYLALGAGLAQAGHTVTLATHATFEPLARAHGLRFAPVAGDPQAILRTDLGQRWLDSHLNPLAFARGLMDIAAPLVPQVLRDALAASQDADALIVSTLGFFAGFHAAEKLRRPLIGAYLQVVDATALYPMCVFPLWLWGGALPAAYNRWTYRALQQALWLLGGGLINRARAAVLGLPPLRGAQVFRLAAAGARVYGFSPHVLPADPRWPPHVQVSGFWHAATAPGYTPPADLAQFLAAGPPPVYVGFGSLLRRNPQALTETVLHALAKTGQRGLLLGGWGGLTASHLPANVLLVPEVPHDWLFPQMAGVVHHGGMGTTAAGLRAGVPSLLTPIFGDQPFWGWRVHALRAGPPPVRHDHLTVDTLARGIEQLVSTPHYRHHAQALAAQLRAEDGVGRAVAFIEQQMGQ